MDRTPAPRAFWQHPLWWVALIALALNDHLLKGSAAPAALTGKLSDFAGLLVAPPLFAYLLARAQVPRARPLGWAAVVGVFAGINLSPGFARLVEGALGWQIWVDPTDLVALPMAALAWRLFAARSAPRSLAAPRRAAIAFGALACIATSPPVEITEPLPPGSGQLQIMGRTESGPPEDGVASEQHVVRVRRLRPEVEVDCDALAVDPRRTVTRDLFAPAERWQLGHWQSIDLRLEGDRSCDVVWIEHEPNEGEEGAGVALATFDGTRGVRIELQRNDAVFGWVEAWTAGRLHRGLPREPSPAPGCAPPALPVQWSETLLRGEHFLEAVEASPDGCTALTVTAAQRRWPDVPGDPSDPEDEGTEPGAPPMDPASEAPASRVPESTRTLYACGVPAVLFEGFAPELPLEVTPDGRWVQTTDEAEVSLRFAATLGVDEEAGDLRFSDALGFDFALEPVAGCTMANGCGERVTPLGVSLDDPWVAIGDDLWAREDGPTAEVVALLGAWDASAIDGACVDGAGAVGPTVQLASRTITLAPEETP
ncbi:MAG TPA: hypothetical protein RMH85_04735 [Polyangiaceae bacterium LLY-WYZ-15_(1-7)]|nr:hypothetical protein [Sandaracinus sp.]HJK94960.1 hypothetical protein [Polyangiaceae bacterium LLY-WYZ-15_(1-7)]HJL00709.1 hypothetical protein [Polyangiaceae bacterium LLY-WYZ-15_(1-7)]HJL07776.1 hypothetical protein [Polyangiaceae bacterium LLY-WYZ-15_(1-7)]HJL27276.1 hypothetical protein [Polyangiaceae bacterium LLY-WYZ-15_(1-7)]